MKMYYRSGELARLCGVSPDTLRHYERLRLIDLPLRSGNGYREYQPATLERVRAIQAALRIGFTLKELAKIFRVRDQGGVPCHEVRDLAKHKLEQTSEQIRELQALHSRLESILKTWENTLDSTPEGQKARLLDDLSVKQTETVHRKTIRQRRPYK